jgi:SMC interacting uncharacterized protein involved in chromosome segregation
MFMKKINKIKKPVEELKDEVDNLIEEVKEVKLNKKIETPKKRVIKNDSKIVMNITKGKKKKEQIKLDTDSDSSDY